MNDRRLQPPWHCEAQDVSRATSGSLALIAMPFWVLQGPLRERSVWLGTRNLHRFHRWLSPIDAWLLPGHQSPYRFSLSPRTLNIPGCQYKRRISRMIFDLSYFNQGTAVWISCLVFQCHVPHTSVTQLCGSCHLQGESSQFPSSYASAHDRMLVEGAVTLGCSAQQRLSQRPRSTLRLRNPSRNQIIDDRYKQGPANARVHRQRRSRSVGVPVATVPQQETWYPKIGYPALAIPWRFASGRTMRGAGAVRCNDLFGSRLAPRLFLSRI